MNWLKFALMSNRVAFDAKDHHSAAIEQSAHVGPRPADQNQIRSDGDRLAETITRGRTGNEDRADESPGISRQSVDPSAAAFRPHPGGTDHEEPVVDRQDRAELVTWPGLGRLKSMRLDVLMALRGMNRDHACRRWSVPPAVVADEDGLPARRDGASEAIGGVQVDRWMDDL